MSNVFTVHETQILINLQYILAETECVYSHDLVKSDPEVLRGALASLVRKGVIDVMHDFPSNINGTEYYPVSWDAELFNISH
jgi:hypothetical protein